MKFVNEPSGMQEYVFFISFGSVQTKDISKTLKQPIKSYRNPVRTLILEILIY